MSLVFFQVCREGARILSPILSTQGPGINQSMFLSIHRSRFSKTKSMGVGCLSTLEDLGHRDCFLLLALEAHITLKWVGKGKKCHAQCLKSAASTHTVDYAHYRRSLPSQRHLLSHECLSIFVKDLFIGTWLSM